ncbi:MAG: hypothetical protein RMJ84_07405 [Sandaracinaceae bacterium]|nr:hypothetical protein [Sandaracinaceae bacterium]
MRHCFWKCFVLLIALFLFEGCAITESDIETWKGTVRGPGKIIAVLLADKFSDELRVRAGVALIEMERYDVDGIAELQGALRKMPEETRRRLVDQMVPRLISILGSGSKQEEGEGPPPPIQVRAKDAAFLILPYASASKQKELMQALVGWLVEDFNNRSLAGNFSAEQIIRQVGSPAASQLVEAMNARLPQQALVKLAELIGQLGDQATKRKAGERIVQIEREMEGPAFGEWIASRLRKQAAASGRQVSENDIARGVAYNREQFIVGGAIPAMHYLADQPVVANRLLEIAKESNSSPEIEARRVAALQALEGHSKPEHNQVLLRIALDSGQPDRVRDYAFDRIGDSKDRSVIPQLWPLAVQSASAAPNAWRVRWRVGSLLLSLGGPEVAAEWFNRLPRSSDEQYAREELYGYAERLSQMRPQPTDLLRSRLNSSAWFEQAIALFYFERVGGEPELAAIEALKTSNTPTKGPHWDEIKTIGALAESVVASMRERLGKAGATKSSP